MSRRGGCDIEVRERGESCASSGAYPPGAADGPATTALGVDEQSNVVAKKLSGRPTKSLCRAGYAHAMVPRPDRREDADRRVSDGAEVIPFRGSRSAGVGETGAANNATGPSSDDPRWSEVLGDVLREERRRQQRTLADVAERAAVSLPYLSEVERGRKEISSDLLAAVITSLEVDLASVLERAAGQIRSGGVGSAQMLAA